MSLCPELVVHPASPSKTIVLMRDGRDAAHQLWEMGQDAKALVKNLITKHKATVQIITDATDPNTANTITNFIGAILQKYKKVA